VAVVCGGGAWWWCVVVVRGGGAWWWCVVVVRGGGTWWWCVAVVRGGEVGLLYERRAETVRLGLRLFLGPRPTMNNIKDPCFYNKLRRVNRKKLI
jgi:hypothetical protein